MALTNEKDTADSTLNMKAIIKALKVYGRAKKVTFISRLKFNDKFLTDFKCGNPYSITKKRLRMYLNDLENYSCVTSLAHPYSNFKEQNIKNYKKYLEASEVLKRLNAIEV